MQQIPLSARTKAPLEKESKKRQIESSFVERRTFVKQVDAFQHLWLQKLLNRRHLFLCRLCIELVEPIDRRIVAIVILLFQDLRKAKY